MGPRTYVPVGRVVKAHGLNGEVSVIPADGLPFVFDEGLRVWFVPPPAGVRDAVVEHVRRGPKGPLVKFSGIEDIDAAHLLNGASIIAEAADLPPGWDEGPEDPVGLVVTDTARGVLGEVVEVIVTGANDVWVIEGGPYGQVLLPVIEQVLLSVDWDAGTADVELLPGLIEDE
jgi:16S rRNA processing protein RimM